MEHVRVRVGSLEQPPHRVAGTRGCIEGLGVVSQRPVSRDRVSARDCPQFAAAFVQYEPHVEERLEPGSEAAARAADALRDRAYPPAPGGI
jgi:hypothetical protein